MKVMKNIKRTLETCDCCTGVSVLTPVTLFNRPGLSTIAYRVGTHGSFLQTMKARLSSSELPKLAGLTTRDQGDALIALLDAWSVVADVLTFYQERIASEGYLRTATERRSILELARLVGYRLRPGVASSVYLAYTLEPTQETTTIEAGNKAQSIPGPNEKPQVFETADSLVAHSSLNLLKLRLTQPQFFYPKDSLENFTIFLKGTATNVRVNDALLLGFEMINPPEARQAVYRALEIRPEPQLDRTTIKLRVQGAAPNFQPSKDPKANTSAAIKAIAEKYLDLDSFDLSDKSKIVKRVSDKIALLKTHADPAGEVQALLPELINEYAFSSNRGYDKIASWLSGMIDELEPFQVSEALQVDRDKSSTDNGTTSPAPGIPSFVELFKPFKEPQSLQPRSEARLGRRVGQIYSGSSDFVAQVYATLQPQAAPFVKSVLVNAGPIEVPTRLPKTEGVIQLIEVQALRLKASLAGHNLPPIVRESSNGNNAATIIVSPPNLGEYVAALAQAGFRLESNGDLKHIALDGQYDQIAPQSNVAIERPSVDNQDSQKGFTTTTHKVTTVQTALLTFSDIQFSCSVLTLDTPWLKEDEIGDGRQNNAIVRSTTVFAQSEALALTEIEMTSDVSFAEGTTDARIELDGLYTSLEPGRWIIISGERVIPDERVVRDGRISKTVKTKKMINTGVQVSELVMVASVSHEAKTLLKDELVELRGEKLHTFIRPAETPAYSYRRNTVKIYGNVVRATHGETRNEVLGSGDGSRALQSFTLRQPPLTYLPEATPSGTLSTLEVRVNDVRWGEADNLFALGGKDRKYVTSTDDDGKTTVTFGNGERGARLPTGVENVKAVYRSGLGKEGNVKADQIKLPLTKPLGVKGVINPLRASGGADKETLVQARRNAPISVLALDRLVSVQDYADFARTFAGIAKASATRLSDGARQVVHLTVAGAGDIPIDPTSELYLNLVAALKRFGDPLQPLQVEVFERVLLVVSAKVGLHPDYLWENVKSKISTAMFDEFGFENRELGQDVPQSEVLRVIQSVPGVNYVDLDLLDSVNEEKLTDPNFGAKLKLKPRVNANLARVSGKEDDILPAQLVFLSPEAKDTLILKEQNERYN